MAVSQAPGGFGRWTRASIFLQVVLVLVLSLGVGLLAIEASTWDPLRFRSDLTFTGRNTLDPGLEQLLRQVPEPVVAETFFQQLPGALQPIWIEARTRTLEVLELASRASPDDFVLRSREVDGLEAMRARLAELGLSGTGANVVVVSCGERREVLRLFGDLTTVRTTPGTVPTIDDHREELALAEALASVTQAGVPRVLVSTGLGEPDLYDVSADSLDGLRQLLEADGFEVAPWNLEADGPVPEGCDVFCLVGSEDPLSEDVLAGLAEWVRGGGRLVVTPGRFLLGPGEGGVGDLTRTWGLVFREGWVCEPLVTSLGQAVEGSPECQILTVTGAGMNAQHPVTQPLHAAGRSVRVVSSRAVERVPSESSAVVLDLLRTTSRDGWREFSSGGEYNWAFDPSREEAGLFGLAATVQVDALPPEAIAELPEGAEIPQGRVAVLGTQEVFTNRSIEWNRDFCLNLFNWLAEREYRLSVSPQEVAASRIDVLRGPELPWMQALGVWVLPGLCALLGVATAWRRRH